MFPPRPTPITRCCPSSLESSQSVSQSCDKIPLSPSSLCPLPLRCCSHIGATPRLPPYTSFHALWLVTLYYPTPLPQYPTSSEIPAGCCKRPPSHYYFTVFCALGTVTIWLPRVVSGWPWSPHSLPWSTTSIYLTMFDVLVPAGTIWCYSGNFSASMVAPAICSTQNVGMALFFFVLGYCHPIKVYWSSFVGHSYSGMSRDNLGMNTSTTEYWFGNWHYTPSESALSVWLVVAPS